jgi:hypothetical protein
MNNRLLEERSTVIVEMIRTTANIYFHPDTTEGQKGLFETLAGAGIWYLPSGLELYSGFISQEALVSLEQNPNETKLVEEHAFPRKIGGRFLYEQFKKIGNEFTKEYFIQAYKTQLGKYNLVLKDENNRLKKFQKIEREVTDSRFLQLIRNIEKESYDAAGIKLCPFPAIKYKEFKKSMVGRKKSTKYFF